MEPLTIKRDELIKQAYQRILPPGYKPEDYFMLGNDMVMRIARLVVLEVFLIQRNKSNVK